MTKLIEIAQLNPKIEKSNLDESSIASFVPMAAVSEITGSVVWEEEREIEKVLKGFTYFQSNDILVAKITPCFENGKIALASVENEHGFGSTEFHVIRCNQEKVDTRYLFHYLRQPKIRIEGEKRMTGSGGQRRVPKAFLEDLDIPLPPLPEQRRIAAILDKAEALRAKRREAIAKLDLLLQSVFLEMFGDLISNPKNFLVRNLTDFYFDPKEGTRCGPFGSALKKSDITEDGVPLWNMDNISLNGEMIMPFSAYVSCDKAKDLNSYCVEDGDILISRAGTVGKMCVVREINKKSLITTNLIRLRFNKDLIPEFFIHLMIYNKGKIGRLQVGPDGAFTHMSTGILDSISFPYPPLSLQKKWVNIRNTIISKKNIFLEQLKSFEKFQQALSIDLFK